MIVCASFRGPGGLASHLRRVDTNERVIVREDLAHHCVLDIVEALVDFCTIERARGVDRCLIHISISPEEPLSIEQEAHMLSRVRVVYRIPDEQPLLVVQHVKPGPSLRPAHYHLVLPRTDATTGKQIRDSFSHIRNERLSLELEVAFEHRLVPGPHLEAVRKAFEIDSPVAATAIAHLDMPLRSNMRATAADKAQAFRSDLDLDEFDARVYRAWTEGYFASGAPSQLGLILAKGNKTVMAVDLRTGEGQSLNRAVNRHAKRIGAPLRLRLADVVQLDRGLESLAAVRRRALPLAVDAARADLVNALTKAREQARERFDPWRATGLARDLAEIERDAQASRVAETIKAQTDAIKAARRQEREVRQATLRHAYQSRRFWGRRELAKASGLAAALATGSVGVGLVAMSAIAVVATIQRARAARTINGVRAAARIDVRGDIAKYFAEVARARRFRLDEIPTEVAVIAGLLYKQVEGSKVPESALINALEASKPGLAARLSEFARYNCSVPLRARMLAMYDDSNPAHRARLTLALQGSTDAPGEIRAKNAEARQVSASVASGQKATQTPTEPSSNVREARAEDRTRESLSVDAGEIIGGLKALNVSDRQTMRALYLAVRRKAVEAVIAVIQAHLGTSASQSLALHIIAVARGAAIERRAAVTASVMAAPLLTTASSLLTRLRDAGAPGSLLRELIATGGRDDVGDDGASRG